MCVYRYLQLCFPGAQLGSPCGLPVTKDRVTLPCGSTEMPHHELNCSSPRPRSHGARTALARRPPALPTLPTLPTPRVHVNALHRLPSLAPALHGAAAMPPGRPAHPAA